MNKSKRSHDDRESDGNQNGHRPYWQGMHHDWRFWVAVFLMILGMVIYMVSDDLSLQPRKQPQLPQPATAE